MLSVDKSLPEVMSTHCYDAVLSGNKPLAEPGFDISRNFSCLTSRISHFSIQIIYDLEENFVQILVMMLLWHVWHNCTIPLISQITIATQLLPLGRFHGTRQLELHSQGTDGVGTLDTTGLTGLVVFVCDSDDWFWQLKAALETLKTR